MPLGSLHFAVVLRVAEHLLPLSNHVEVKLGEDWGEGTGQYADMRRSHRHQPADQQNTHGDVGKHVTHYAKVTVIKRSSSQIHANACKRLVLNTVSYCLACGLTRNVGDHDEDEEGVVVKGEVVLVGEGDGVQARLLHVRQRRVDGQQLPAHSHGIQGDEEGVPVQTGKDALLHDGWAGGKAAVNYIRT